MARELKLGRHVVNDRSPAYVIAEVGHNHQGKLETAKEMFKQAQACGVSAVKLQKRDNRGLFTQAAFDRPYENENSFGATYGQHREALEFDREQYVELQQYAAELGLDFFATAFDVASADMLEMLDMPAYKVASADLRNLPLLRHIAGFGKPMIASTGGGSMEDVIRAYETSCRSIRSFVSCSAPVAIRRNLTNSIFGLSKLIASSSQILLSVTRVMTMASRCHW